MIKSFPLQEWDESSILYVTKKLTLRGNSMMKDVIEGKRYKGYKKELSIKYDGEEGIGAGLGIYRGGNLILMVYVKREYRKKGIGKEIIREMIKKLGIDKVTVFAWNAGSKRFYKKVFGKVDGYRNVYKYENSAANSIPV